MARRRRSSQILEFARKRLAGIKSITSGLDLGPRLSVDSFEQRIEGLAEKLATYNQMLASLDLLLNELQAEEHVLRVDFVRMLAAIGAYFGPDSNEYEQAGGTRSSERNRPVRRVKPQLDGPAMNN
jgi:hypothetical protein